jgi:dUTPase
MNALKLFVHGDVKPPQRAPGDAGVDFYTPNLSEQFIKDLSDKNPGQPFRWGLVGAPKEGQDQNDNDGVYLYIPPGEDLLIPTYVCSRMDSNVVLQVNNKSGVATNQKLAFGANIIDASYQGMIHIHVYNYSNNLRFISFGQKLVQMVPILYNDKEIEIFYDETNDSFKQFKNTVTKDKFFEAHEFTNRGDKGFGNGTGLN